MLHITLCFKYIQDTYKSLGHLKWNRNYSNGVYCGIPVEVTLDLYQNIYNEYGELTEVKLILKVIFKGQFVKGNYYCM